MASPNPDDSLLLIRCPSCGQRFKVGEDLRDRTVECGGCENRFRIDDEVIVRGRKFYPGERKVQQSNRFQRVPLPGGEKSIGVEPMFYSNQTDPAVLEPISPQRIMAGLVGVSGMVVVALALMFGTHRGGILDGMDLTARLMISGFAALLGVALLFYASPRARFKALAFGLFMAAGVMALAVKFNGGDPVVSNEESDSRVITYNSDPDSEATAGGEGSGLEEEIGMKPLTTEIGRLAKAGSDKRAFGLWLRGMGESNRYVIKDYIFQVTGADIASHFYPRDNGDYLFVVTGISTSLDELAKLAEPLGQVVKTYPELSVIEVKVSNENFVESPNEKLTDRENPDFYVANRRELESIDKARIKRAVQRLKLAEPKVYRADISRKLESLMELPGIDFKPEVAQAILVWSEKPGVAGAAAYGEIRRRFEAGEPVPVEIMAVAVKDKNAAVIPLLDQLWAKTPLAWEELYGDVGNAAESTMLKRFPETQGLIRYSAVRVLGRIGGRASLPVLEAAQAGADSELRILLDQARKSILGRIKPE